MKYKDEGNPSAMSDFNQIEAKIKKTKNVLSVPHGVVLLFLLLFKTCVYCNKFQFNNSIHNAFVRKKNKNKIKIRIIHLMKCHSHICENIHQHR